MTEGPEAEIARLREEVRYLRSILRHAGDLIVTADAEGRVIEWGGAAERVLGFEAADVVGRPAAGLWANPAERAAVVARLRELPPGPALTDREVALRAKDGSRIWVTLSFAAIPDPAGGPPIGTVCVAKDVSERRRLEQELRRHSVTDRLTGLYNQSHFFERLEIEKERAARLWTPLSLLLFDLDRFKEYNDRAGHLEGDRALRAVGGVIFSSIRKEVDSGFRYGGDEFCVLLPGSTADAALNFAERVRVQVEALGAEGGCGGITASLGISQHDASDHGQQIVKEADGAMYRAKRAGGNCIRIAGAGAGEEG